MTLEPDVNDLYLQLCKALGTIGEFTEETKKTSIHLVRKSAFAGVHPRKKYLIITVKAGRALDSPRIFKSEQLSKNRWHHEVKLTSPSEIDAELIGWLSESYELSA